MKRVAIFGAGSAIAQAFARQLAMEGAHLYLVARNQTALVDIADDLRARGAGKVSVAAADLAELSALPALCDRARASLGGIDIALVAHGVLPDQAECEKSPEAIQRIMQVNTLSPMLLLSRLGAIMAEQGAGALAVISSVAGDRGRPSNYIYGASKASLSVMGEGLALSLASKGVDVLVVKPGFVDTPMTAAFPKGPLWSSSNDVADEIVTAIKKRKRGVLYTPGWWRLIMLVIKFAPSFLVRRL
jgi:decaprenylphospho-beta-D-erythro-pentofuranosid-2-ulose 2-reductase